MPKNTQEIDALIINPSALYDIYQELANHNLIAVEPPIWAALIANSLRFKNYKVDIIDCEGLNLNVEETIKKIEEYKTKLIVIVVYGQQPSASTQNMYAASILCNKIKEYFPNIKVAFMGGHISALPQKTMEEERADFLCYGEAIKTIVGLLEGRPYNIIPGLWYRENGVILSNSPATLITQEELPKELPGMAFDLLPMHKYRAHNWHCFGNINERQPYASIYTSLGCPFKCTFCCINAPFNGSSFRYWNPQFIIEQFDILADKYNVKNIKIADEMFVLRESHFLELCKLMVDRAYNFNIWAYARVDTVKPKYLDIMKQAGINWLALGIESKSKFVRNGVDKGRFKEDDIIKVVKDIKESNINVMGNFIFGLPDDNLDTMNETLQMALDLNCEMANFYSAMAYPGSQLYKMAIEENTELPKTWLGYSQHAIDTLPLPTKHISANEVLKFRDYAWSKYFTSPSYLNLVREKFGQETVNHLEKIAKISLVRKYVK